MVTLPAPSLSGLAAPVRGVILALPKRVSRHLERLRKRQLAVRCNRCLHAHSHVPFSHEACGVRLHRTARLHVRPIHGLATFRFLAKGQKGYLSRSSGCWQDLCGRVDSSAPALDKDTPTGTCTSLRQSVVKQRRDAHAQTKDRSPIVGRTKHCDTAAQFHT